MDEECFICSIQSKLWSKTIFIVFGQYFKRFTVDNMKKTGLNIWFFFWLYNSIDGRDFVDIHKYLMKKHKIVFKQNVTLTKYFYVIVNASLMWKNVIQIKNGVMINVSMSQC